MAATSSSSTGANNALARSALVVVLLCALVAPALSLGVNPYNSNGTQIMGMAGDPVQPEPKSDNSFPAWALGPILGVGIPLAVLLFVCFFLLIAVVVLVVIKLLSGGDDDNERGGSRSGGGDFEVTSAAREKTDYRAGRGGAAAGSTATSTQTGLGNFDIDLSKEAESVAAAAAAEQAASPRRAPIKLMSPSGSLRDYREAQ